MPYYAVAKGRTPGIFLTWPDCESQVKGYPGARYKKFPSINEAQSFIEANGGVAGPSKRAPVRNNENKLKRSFSTAAKYSAPIKKTNYNKRNYSSEESDFSDLGDEFSGMLNQQMDHIEKRIKAVQRNVDKISKNNGKKAIMIEPQNKRIKHSSGFEIDRDGFVEVYTDGACSSNGRVCAKAGLGVYWGENHPLNISEPVSGRATNNCGEIQAATKAIHVALQNGVSQLKINTDSKFLINSVTKWMPGWKRKGWRLKTGEPVKNERDFKELDGVQNKLCIRWNYVEAHRGIQGNERADELAKQGAAMYRN